MSEDLLAATEAIYSRLETGWDWTPVVQELAGLVDAGSGCVVIGNGGDDGPTVGCFHNIDPEWIRVYDAYYHQYDPTFRTLSAWPGKACVDHVTGERTSELQGAARTFYHEVMRPQQFRHTLALGVQGSDGFEAALIFQRSAADGGFGQRAVRSLDCLAGHIQRSLDLQIRLDQIGAEANGFRDAIEQAPLGVVVLNARGRPVYVNSCAESILAEAQYLALQRDGLASPHATTHRKLNELIQGAALAARGAPGYQGGRLLLALPGERQGLRLQVDPLRTSAEMDGVAIRQARVIVWLTPIGRGEGPCSRRLREAYDLTAAEAELLAALVNGQRVNEIAQVRRVSHETVRTQLKSLMVKFGVNRQADLVRAVLQGGCADDTGPS